MEQIANLFNNLFGLDLESKFGIRLAFGLSVVLCLCIFLEWICIIKILKRLKKEVKDEKDSLGQQTLFTFSAFLHTLLTPQVLGIILFVLSAILAFSTLFLIGTIIRVKHTAGYQLRSKHAEKIAKPKAQPTVPENINKADVEENIKKTTEEILTSIMSDKPISPISVVQNTPTEIKQESFAEEIQQQPVEEEKAPEQNEETEPIATLPVPEEEPEQEQMELEEDEHEFTDEDLLNDSFDEGEAPADWLTPGDKIIGFDDATGNYQIASYRYTLEAKISLSGNAIQNTYASIKNLLLSYRDVESFMSSTMEEFSYHSTVLARIFYRSGCFEMMFAISPRTLRGTCYKGVDCTHKSKFGDTPFLYKLSTMKKVAYALDLCKMVCEAHHLEETNYQPIRAEKMFPTRSKEDLIKQGLITEYIHEERPTVTFELDIEKADEIQEGIQEETPREITEETPNKIPEAPIETAPEEEPISQEKQEEIPEQPIQEPKHIAPKKEATEEEKAEIDALKKKEVLTPDDLSKLFEAAAKKIDCFEDDEDEEPQKETPVQPIKPEPIPEQQAQKKEQYTPQPLFVPTPKQEQKAEEPKQTELLFGKKKVLSPASPSYYRNRNYYATEEEKNLPPNAEASKIEKIVYKDQNGNVIQPEDIKKGMFVVGKDGAYLPVEKFAEKKNSGINLPEEPKQEAPAPKPLKNMRIEEGTVGIVDIGRYQSVFQDGDTVSLETLKQKDILSVRIETLKIWCSEPLNKRLTVEADKFTTDALMQIENAGGSAVITR